MKKLFLVFFVILFFSSCNDENLSEIGIIDITNRKKPEKKRTTSRLEEIMRTNPKIRKAIEMIESTEKK